MSAIEIKSKLTIKDLDNPKKGAGLDEVGQKVVLGTLIGIATDTFTKTNETGDTMTGLRGQFRGIPANAERPTVEAGILWLPESVTELIESQLYDEEGNRAAASVSFGYEVSSVRATNAAGYSFSFRPLQEPTNDDPLSRLAVELKLPAPTTAPQLAAPGAKKKG